MKLQRKLITLDYIYAFLLSISLLGFISLFLFKPINQLFLIVLEQINKNPSLIGETIITTNHLNFIDVFLFLQPTSLNFLLTTDSLKINGQVVLGVTILLFLFILPFIVSGFYLAFKQKSFFHSVVIILTSYTFFLLLVTFIYENSTHYLTVQLTFFYRIQFLFVLFFIFISLFIGYELYYRFFSQERISYLRSLSFALKAVAMNLLIYLFIVTAFFVVFFSMIKERFIYMFVQLPIQEWFTLSIQFVLTISSQLAAYLLGLVHLLPISLSIEDHLVKRQADFSIKNGIYLDGEVSIGNYSLFIVRDLLNKIPYDEYLIYLLIIPMIILIFVGYKMSVANTSFKSVISFSFFYSLLISIFVYYSTTRISFITESSSHQLNLMFSFIPLVIYSFIIAMIGITIGFILRRIQQKLRNS